MFTFTIFTIGAILIGFYFGAFWLATAVTGAIFAKLFPLVTTLIVFVAIGLVGLRLHSGGKRHGK